jgi:hypothetical protein
MNPAGEDHGQLLFKDGFDRRGRSFTLFITGVISVVIGAGLLRSIFFDPEGYPPGWILFGLTGLGLGIFLLYQMKRFRNFKVYEDGMELTSAEFVHFRNIEHIALEGPERITVYANLGDNFPLSISSVDTRAGTTEKIGDWQGFYTQFMDRVKATHKGEDMRKFIWDFQNVEWSEEARTALETNKSGKYLVSEARSKAVESVFKDGRNRVELADVQKYLK